MMKKALVTAGIAVVVVMVIREIPSLRREYKIWRM
jgi:hypothetical protein